MAKQTRVGDDNYVQLNRAWETQSLPTLPESLQVIANTISTTIQNAHEAEEEQDKKLTDQEKQDMAWMEERYLLYYRDRFDASKLVVKQIVQVQVPERVPRHARAKTSITTTSTTNPKMINKQIVIAVLKKGTRLFHGAVSEYVQIRRNSYFALWPGVGEMILAEKQLVLLEGIDSTVTYKPAYMYEYEVKHDIYLEKAVGISLAHSFASTPGLSVETVGFFGTASTLIPDIFGNIGTPSKELLELDFPDFLHFIDADRTGLYRRTAVNNVEVLLDQPERDLTLIRKWNINVKTMLERWYTFFRDFQMHKRDKPSEMTEGKIEEAKLLFAYGPRLEFQRSPSMYGDKEMRNITDTNTTLVRRTPLQETVNIWLRVQQQNEEIRQRLDLIKEMIMSWH